MQKDIKHVALVTGASSGIGLEFAHVLAEKKIDLILVARRKERLEALQAELEQKQNIKVHVIYADLSLPGAADLLFQEVQKTGLSVSILINNAGVGQVQDFLKMDAHFMESMIALNITTPTILTRLFAQEMKKLSQGYILQVSSIGAFQPSPYFSVYSATKAYILSFGEAASYELKKDGVTVTTIYPGNTATEFLDVAKVKQSQMTTLGSMKARDVAKIGIDSLFAKRVAVIPGVFNKINSFLIKLMPRSWATQIMGLIGGMLRQP